MWTLSQLKNIFKFSAKDRVFLDFASGTPTSKKALAEFVRIKKDLDGNPSSIYKEGLRASQIIEDSRKDISKIFGAHVDGVFFTSGATESNNIAVQGTIKSFEKLNKTKSIVLVSPYEHKSVSESAKILGAEVLEMPTLSDGVIDLKKTKEIINGNNISVVSVSFCSNETGMVLPVQEIAKFVRHKRKEAGSIFPILHSDVTHAILSTEIKLDSYGADILTFGGSKIYGPKGVGVLIKKLSLEIEPIFGGGGQEGGLRSGTQNTADISALNVSLKEAVLNRNNFSKNSKELKEFLIEVIKNEKLNVNIIEYKERIDSIIAIVVPKIESELLVIELDAKGLAVSSASACTKFSNTPVRAYEVSGVDLKNDGVIRISFGVQTSKGDLQKLGKALGEIVLKYKGF